jgi:PAS domain S-box-containing protein
MENGSDGLNEGIPPELTAAPPDAMLIVVASQGKVVNVSRKGGEPLGRCEKKSAGRALQRAFVLRDGSEGALGIDGGPPEVPVHEPAGHGQAGERELLASRIIDLLNMSEGLAVTIHEILESIKLFSGAEAAGIRLCQGDDYPYYESAGFAPTHLRTESSLCARDAGGMPERNGGGMPLLECMCGNVIEGRTDPAMPCFTKYGSFRTSDASGLLESLSEKQRRMFSRGVCIAEGYQSLALIPLRSGREIVGLLQLNDRRKGRFGPELVEFLEGMGESVGVAFARKVALEKLKESERDMALYNRMADIFLTIPEKDTYTELLAVILKAMDSRLGVFGVIEEDGALALRSMTRQLFERPVSEGVLPVFPRDGWGDDPWSRALNGKCAMWSNEPSPLLPRGLARVRRHISQPIVHKGEVIGLLCVADREAAYTEADVRTIGTIADHLAPVLQARLERDRRMKERDRSDTAQHDSERRYKELVDNLSDVVVETDVEGKILFVSSRVEEAFGFRPEELVGKKFTDFVHPDDVERARAAVSGLSKEKPSFEFEFMRRHRDGRFIQVSTHGRLVGTGGAPRVVAIVEDITSRKKGEEALRRSEEKYRELVENINDAIFSTNLEGMVTYISPAVEQILGFRPEEVTGRRLLDLVAGDDLERITAEYRATMAGELRPSEYRMKAKSGEVRWVRTSSRPILAGGAPSGLSGMLEDITKRKASEDMIRAQLKEKEVMLKEIYHRVKNNLQIIQSLLNMQARRVKDDRVVQALRESQNRIRSMALVHERLYRSSDLSEIDFKDYLGRLVAELGTSFGVRPDQVRILLELAEVKLGIGCAIPCGLIVNELVSNALKHAFPNGKLGRIRIGLDSGGDGMVRVSVFDDGVGLPENFDFRKTETLGLQLVCTLVKQLGGTIELEQTWGTGFRMAFNPAAAEAG